MGDVGSAPLGFLSAGLSLWGIRDEIFPAWVPLLVFSPFIVDATVTLVKRLLKGEKVWQAHRSHYYQRLVQLGWGHKKTVLVEYGLMAAVGLTALCLTRIPDQEIVMLGLVSWGGIYLLFAIDLATNKQTLRDKIGFVFTAKVNLFYPTIDYNRLYNY